MGPRVPRNARPLYPEHRSLPGRGKGGSLGFFRPGSFQKNLFSWGPMIVTVQLFASLREAMGDTIELEVSEPATVRELLDRLVEEFPEFEAAKKSLNVAVDYQYSQMDREILPGQEVAIFPPVSGG